ncbi:unnamed protein product [Spirodela intermedia]|uniref:Uncharacterized protein n=1 Tax=Spirodela intermedia TaxID=51605 RepID=A0ABN7EBL8_SPIIN|nr:unnamed protein product [Spirodela intermedia]
MLDIMEGRSHGRLMSSDSATARTEVLLGGLYIPTASPCRRIKTRRCRRYHVLGEKKGAVDHFVDSLPGFPDNIRYEDEGHFWIAFSVGKSKSWDLILRYPMLRKMAVVSSKLADFPHHSSPSYALVSSGADDNTKKVGARLTNKVK